MSRRLGVAGHGKTDQKARINSELELQPMGGSCEATDITSR